MALDSLRTSQRLIAVHLPIRYALLGCSKNIRVIRTLRRLGYLEASLDSPVPTGYDPLVDAAPELARTMAALGQQRIAFGELASGGGALAPALAPRARCPR
jgi:hypothetical protein